MSCTECLGFESFNERTFDDHQVEEMTDRPSSKARWRKDYHHGSGGGERKDVKKFPPPLSSESFDARTVDDHQMEEMTDRPSSKARWTKDYHHGGGGDSKKVKKFPPPLSTFNRNGRPSFYLRSVRSDGRLELTEVKIDRPEILRASRDDGQLRESECFRVCCLGLLLLLKESTFSLFLKNQYYK